VDEFRAGVLARVWHDVHVTKCTKGHAISCYVQSCAQILLGRTVHTCGQSAFKAFIFDVRLDSAEKR